MTVVKTFTGVAAILLMITWSTAAQAQSGCGSANCSSANCGGAPGSCVPCGNCDSRPGCSCPTACNGVGPEGYCIGCPTGHRGLGPAAVAFAAADQYSPNRFYSYSAHGLDATRMHRWNWRQSAANPWHGNYNYWRYGQPTALVVPPTAAFQTEYNWGVAQTKSLPIYHQYSRDFGGAGGVTGGDETMNTPYWPSSTRQFGIYPVRGPW